MLGDSTTLLQLNKRGSRILSNPTLPAIVLVAQAGPPASPRTVWEGGAVLRAGWASRNSSAGPPSRLCPAAHNLRTVTAFPRLPPASNEREANKPDSPLSCSKQWSTNAGYEHAPHPLVCRCHCEHTRREKKYSSNHGPLVSNMLFQGLVFAASFHT